MRYKKRLPFLPVPHLYNSRLTKREGKHNLGADEMTLFKIEQRNNDIVTIKIKASEG